MTSRKQIRDWFARRLPMRTYSRLRRLLYLPRDILDAALGRRPPLTPPRRLAFVYGSEFEQTGREFFRHFTAIGGLQPHQKVLDVGCGIGRTAVPLTDFLSPPGEYLGFDIIPEAIAWCRRHITPRFPHFRFHLADVFNASYNPSGTYAASEFVFPSDDARFDFAYSTSVFTHMLPRDMERYMNELVRVLKPGGKTLNTFFVLNQATRTLAASARLDFRHAGDGYWSVSPQEPEKAVAYDEASLRQLHARVGLAIVEPIRYGSWSGRRDGLSGQDIILAVKT